MQQRSYLATTFVFVFYAASVEVLPVAPNTPDRPAVAAINDNRRPAGTRTDGTLAVNLRAAAGLWHPEGVRGPALQIEAFGEGSGPLQVPGPLIRVPEGTEVIARLRNELDRPLRVHGLCTRDGSLCAPMEIQPAAESEVRFKTGRRQPPAHRRVVWRDARAGAGPDVRSCARSRGGGWA